MNAIYKKTKEYLILSKYQFILAIVNVIMMIFIWDIEAKGPADRLALKHKSKILQKVHIKRNVKRLFVNIPKNEK